MNKRSRIILVILGIVGGSLLLLLIPIFDVNSVNSWNYSQDYGYSSAKISEDGKYVAMCTHSPDKNSLKLVKTSDKEVKWEFEYDDDSEKFEDLEDVCITENGDYLVGKSKYYDRQLFLFDTSFSKNYTWHYNASRDINSVAISDKGEYVLIGEEDQYAHLFNYSSSEPIWKLELYQEYPPGEKTTVDISKDGQFFALCMGLHYTEGGNCQLNVYNNSNDNPTELWNYIIPGDEGIVKMSDDGKHLIAGGKKEIYYFDTLDSEPKWSTTISGGEVKQLQISADGENVVVITDKMYFFKSDSENYQWTADYKGSCCMSSDGKYIAMSNQGEILLFSAESNAPLWSYKIMENFSQSAFGAPSISEDGKYIVTLVDNFGVYLFNRETYEKIVNFFIPWVVIEYIAIGVATALIGWRYRVVKIRKKKEKEEKEYKKILKEIKKLVKGSDKVKIDTIKEKIDVDEKVFYSKLVDWVSEFNFKVDGEYLLLNEETVSDFIDALDGQFQEWEKLEVEGKGKKI